MGEAQAPQGPVRRIYGNLGRLLSGKLAAGLISLAYLAIAARSLGARDYGVLVLVHGYAVTVGGLIGFPGWHAVVRYGAQAVAADDSPRLGRLLRAAGLVEALAALAAIAVAAGLAPVIGPRLGWSSVAIAFAGPYSLAVLASMRATPAGYLQLRGRFDLLGAHSVAAPVVRLIGGALAAVLHAGLQGFLIAWLAAAVAECLVMWALGVWVARRHLPWATLLGGVRGASGENPGLWRFMLAANADITFTELAGRLSPLAVGWVLGPAAAGLYAVAQRATAVLAQPALVLGQAAYAELAGLAAAGRRGQVRGALLRCVGIAALAALPVLLLIVIFGRPLAVLLGGSSFAGAAGVMAWLAFARAAAVIGPPIRSALTALGRPALSVAANLTAGLVVLSVLPLMMQRWGLAGAGANALLQALAATVLLAWLVLRETRGDRAVPAAAGG